MENILSPYSLEQELTKIRSFCWQVSCAYPAKSLTDHMVQEQVKLHFSQENYWRSKQLLHNHIFAKKGTFTQ